MMRILAFACFLLAATQSSFTAESPWQAALLRDHPLAGKIYHTASGKFISETELVQRVRSIRHVLLGEIHDNAEHHALQGRIMFRLAQSGRTPTIVLEMLGAKQSAIVEKLNASWDIDMTQLSHGPIGELTRWWDTSGWPPMETYSHIFGIAHGKRLKLAVGEPLPPSPERVDDVLKEVPLDKAASDALNEELKISHCGVLPDAVIPKIAVAQRRRDIKLALAMISAGGDGTILISGSGHARQDRGVPHYLEQFGEQSVTINFREVADGKTNPSDLIEAGEADYIWFTPRHKREDPCIALRKRFGKSTE